MPMNIVALALIEALGEAMVGPSANLSGRPSPTNAQHVYDDLRGKVDLILDSGPTEIGLESTVIDVTLDPPTIYRLGGLDRERIEKLIGEVRVATSGEGSHRSPGTRHRHYAPRARVILVTHGDADDFARHVQLLRQQGKKVGSITNSRQLATLETGSLARVLPSAIAIFAQHLYRTMRELDSFGLDVMVVEGVPEEGLGAAVMDRLRRAAQV